MKLSGNEICIYLAQRMQQLSIQFNFEEAFHLEFPGIHFSINQHLKLFSVDAFGLTKLYNKANSMNQKHVTYILITLKLKQR